MSYSTGIAMRANLMEKDRSGGIRLARSPPGMWGGGRSLHSQSGKEKHPRYAQGLVRGRTGCPKWVLFSSTPHHKLPRQVMWELRVIFHLIEKQLTNPPKKPTNHWLNYHLKRKGKKKGREPADLKHPRSLNRGRLTIQTHSILVCYFPSCCVNDPSVFAFTTLPDRPFHTFIILDVKKCFLTSVLNLF